MERGRFDHLAVSSFRALISAFTLTKNLLTFGVGRTLETNVGIICGCLPSLNPIFRILHDKGYFSTSLRSIFSASNRKSSGSEDDERSKDKEKNTYRVLVESGQSKGRERSQNYLEDKESESGLPDMPLAALHTKKSLSEQPQQGDIEQGRIWVTDQFGYH